MSSTTESRSGSSSSSASFEAGQTKRFTIQPVSLAAHAAVLGQPLVERQLLRRKGRRVVDQPAEEGAPRICQRLVQPAVM